METIKLYLLPIHQKVIFPYQSLNIRIPENYNYDGNYKFIL